MALTVEKVLHFGKFIEVVSSCGAFKKSLRKNKLVNALLKDKEFVYRKFSKSIDFRLFQVGLEGAYFIRIKGILSW